MSGAVPRGLLLAGLGLGALVPVVLFVLGALMLVETQRFVAAAEPVTAEVLRLDPDGRPVLGVADPDGALREAAPHPADSGWRPSPGSTAEMLRDPAAPDLLRRSGVWPLYGTASLFLLFGLVAELALFVALWRLVLRPARRG